MADWKALWWIYWHFYQKFCTENILSEFFASKIHPRQCSRRSHCSKIFLEPVFRKCLQKQITTILTRKSLELPASWMSFVTHCDIIQLDQPFIHQTWHLSISRNQIHPQRRNRYSCWKWFSKDSEAILRQALLWYIMGHRASRKWEGIWVRQGPAHRGPRMVRGVNQMPKTGGSVRAKDLAIPWLVQAVSGSSLIYRSRKPLLRKILPFKHGPQRLRAAAPGLSSPSLNPSS